MRPLALLVVLAGVAFGQTPGEILAKLRPIRDQRLADFVAFYTAQFRYDAGGDQKIVDVLAPVWRQTPKSPLTARAAVLAARFYLRSGEPRSAAEILQKYYSDLTQPEGDITLANAWAAAGERDKAVTIYQRVFAVYPTSPAALEAQAALGTMGALPLPPRVAFSRGLRLLESGNHRQARTELQAVIANLSAPELDVAKVRIGVTYYNARENSTAFEYLRTLTVTGPEADAERLFYLLQCARRLNNLSEVRRILGQLATQYPRSKWRLDALIAAANNYLVTNQPAEYEPLFRACANEFPDAPQAGACHWRIAFAEYMRRNPTATDLLRAHVKLYPKSDKVPGALYFLGRAAEQAGDAAGARSYYLQIDRDFPNYYYAVLARQRLQTTAQQPSQKTPLDFKPNPTARFRLDRARLLAGAGLDDLAELELSYGARTEDQPHVLAMAMADSAFKQDRPERAIRLMKRYAPGYLYMPISSAPLEFWKAAFPLPYREPLEKFAKDQDLDPFLVAALVRQESEFDKNAISRARAYGLAQVLPSTGRELARKMGIAPFSSNMLFRPEINLRLGSRYLRTMLGQLDDRLEATLAAYNAGKSRAVAWQSWYDYREPAEFVEMVPFSETHNYIQSVIRNADIYRRLYGTSK